MQVRVSQIQERLKELYDQLYNKNSPRNFWGLRFTEISARDHYDETRELKKEFYRLTGTHYEYKKEEPSFGKKRFLEKYYPQGVWPCN